MTDLRGTRSVFRSGSRLRGLALSAALALTLAALAAIDAEPVEAQSLRGSAASLDRQNQQARAHDFTYLQTPAQLRRFVELGYLVPVRPTDDLGIANVSFPYTRPEVRLFLHRLSAQYRAACGERLVVTSLTRPISNQPPNASSRSVHPTGMAVDLRRSGNARCRSWLESTLLSLEGRGLVEAIYERNPPHYHIAVYPQPYAQYVAALTEDESVVAQAGQDEPDVRLEWVTHTVRRGENLTAIASRYESTVTRIRSENGLRGSRILAGQELRIPVYREVPAATGTVTAQAPATAETDESAEAGPEESAEAGLDSGETGTSAASEQREHAGGELTHRVARGESLWSIARRYGVSQGALQQANALRGTRILVGQELTIPVAGTGEAPAVVEHRVARGESLWTIARRHGTTVDTLRRANDIGGSGQIHPGQVLRIPITD